MAAFITEYTAVIINAIALLIIAYRDDRDLLCGAYAPWSSSSPTGHELRDGYLRYARWLIAGLTFQLAADIIEHGDCPDLG